jgi:arylsulfatase
VWELYHVDRDPNELHDLAKQHPDKLAELQALFDGEATRNHVYPLERDIAGFRRQQVAQQLAERGGVFEYTGIVRGLSNDAAPATYRSAFELRATFDVAASGTRVLVAHGGAMGGYSLYVKDGAPVYCYNFLGGETSYVRGPALTPGRHELLLRFQPDGQGGAQVVMKVEGAGDVAGAIPRLTPMMYEASDGFSVGVDQGSNVSPETVDAAAAPVASLRFEFPQGAKPRAPAS